MPCLSERSRDEDSPKNTYRPQVLRRQVDRLTGRQGSTSLNHVHARVVVEAPTQLFEIGHRVVCDSKTKTKQKMLRELRWGLALW